MAKKLEIKELNIEHLSAVMELQKKVIGDLHEDEKHFVLTRSAQDFIKALEHEHTYMLGVFDGDKLIAQSIFELPQDGKSRDLSEFASEIPNDKLVIYKATLVDKDYRGCGIMAALLEYREKKAKEAGRITAISQIAIDNPASWINSIHYGMVISKVDKDPDDGAMVLYMRKDFNAQSKKSVLSNGTVFRMHIGSNIHKTIPTLYNKMRYLVDQGYRGVGINQKDNSILWMKPTNMVNSNFINMTTHRFQDKTIRN